MSILTESELRKAVKDNELKPFGEFTVKKGVIITPSARSFLNEHKITLKVVEAVDEKHQKATSGEVVKTMQSNKYKYTTEYGGFLDEKPEYMTQIRGNVLVFKDHKIIAFRGKIDSLESEILKAQIEIKKMNLNSLVKNLQEILDFVRNILRCEVLNEALGEINLVNMNEQELRDISHNPKKYFDREHIFYMDSEMGEVPVILNSLRSKTRETELVAYEAFKDTNGRAINNDIMRALNRLSSLFYIMIFKYLKGQYEKG